MANAGGKISKVFVYGTLKQGFPNHHLLSHPPNGTAKLATTGYTKEKYPLVLATEAGIPFMLKLPHQGEHVKGEVYDVSPEALPHLDHLEDHPHWYKRTPCQIITQDGQSEQEITCEAYFLVNQKDSLLQNTFLKEYTLQFVKQYNEKRHMAISLSDLKAQVQKNGHN